ncbi:MAG: hypothetical protein QW067_12415 [Thermofilaceae archaeon]
MNLRLLGFSVTEMPEGYPYALRVAVDVAVGEEIGGREEFLGVRRVEIQLRPEDIPEELASALAAVSAMLVDLAQSQITQDIQRERQEFPARYKGLVHKVAKAKRR